MKVFIDTDERYPDYSIQRFEDADEWHRERYHSVEIDAELYQRYVHAAEAYRRVQDELAEIEDSVPPPEFLAKYQGTPTQTVVTARFESSRFSL